MKGCVRAVLLALSVCLLAPANAEVPATPQPRQLTVADGLPSSTINAFAEDRTGYLWLASRDGLARYDGRSYRVWRAEDGLQDNQVWSLHVDPANAAVAELLEQGLIPLRLAVVQMQPQVVRNGQLAKHHVVLRRIGDSEPEPAVQRIRADVRAVPGDALRNRRRGAQGQHAGPGQAKRLQGNDNRPFFQFLLRHFAFQK